MLEKTENVKGKGLKIAWVEKHIVGLHIGYVSQIVLVQRPFYE